MQKIPRAQTAQPFPQSWPEDIVKNVLLPALGSRPRTRDILAFAHTCRQFWDWSRPWRECITLSDAYRRSAQSNLRVTVLARDMQDTQKRLLACAVLRKAPAAHSPHLNVVKELAELAEWDEDRACLLAMWPADALLGIASDFAFPNDGHDANGHGNAQKLLSSSLYELPRGKPLDKLALMVAGAARLASTPIDLALMDALERVGKSAQVEILVRVCAGPILRSATGQLMQLIRARLLDGRLLSHADADRCLYWAYSNARQLPAAEAAGWLGTSALDRLQQRILALARPKDWSDDRGWVLQLLHAARRIYRNDQATMSRVFLEVGRAMEEGGWKYMEANEFNRYCAAITASEMTGHVIWTQANPARPEEKCVIS